MTPRASPITFGILKSRKAKPLSVSDDEVAEAIRFAWDKHQLVVEPGAAVGLAALLAGKVSAVDDSVVVLSGGNVDPALHARIVSTAA
jgi:threonine dehydratase